MIKKIILCLAILLSSPHDAWAAGNKCADKENDAERWIRLHSELMVTTVTCTYGSNGQKLVDAYSAFTQKNLKTLQNAEKTLIAYYKTKSKGDGLDELDSLRTRLANEYGQKIANVSAPSYCARNRDSVLVFSGMTPSQVELNLPSASFCK